MRLVSNNEEAKIEVELPPSPIRCKNPSLNFTWQRVDLFGYPLMPFEIDPVKRFGVIDHLPHWIDVAVDGTIRCGIKVDRYWAKIFTGPGSE